MIYRTKSNYVFVKEKTLNDLSKNLSGGAVFASSLYFLIEIYNDNIMEHLWLVSLRN